MLFAQVSEDAQQELKAALRTAQEVKWYRRLKIIDLSSQGHAVSALANWFDVDEASVRNYIKRYNLGGLASLQPGQSPGRSTRIHLTKTEWNELLSHLPSQFEQLQTRSASWSQPLLQSYLHHYHQIEVTQGTISATLKRQGIRWKRAKKK